jgi:hypothetical protein
LLTEPILFETLSSVGAFTKDTFIKIVRGVAWAPLSVLIGHSVFAKFFGHEPYVDPVMHFFGGVAAAYFFRKVSMMSDEVLGELTDFSRDLLSFGLTCSIALFWEIAEFSSDIFLGTDVQASNANTMCDLILGVIGALMFLLLRRLLFHKKGSGGYQGA